MMSSSGRNGAVSSIQALGSTGAAKTIDVSGAYVTGLLTAACTLTFPSPAAGSAYQFTLELTQDGTGTRLVTWPSSVKWPNNVAPTLSVAAGKVDIFSFVTRDGGATWHGSTVGLTYAA